MIQITADDVRILARSPEPDAALVLRDGRPIVLSGGEVNGDALNGGEVDGDEVSGGEVSGDAVLYTKRRLVDEYGEEITDIEAELLAANLTAQSSPG